MKQLEHQILVKQAQIASLRFLRSGAASPSLAHVASLEEMARTNELAELQRMQDREPELPLNVVEEDEPVIAVNFSKQPPKAATEAGK